MNLQDARCNNKDNYIRSVRSSPGTYVEFLVSCLLMQSYLWVCLRRRWRILLANVVQHIFESFVLTLKKNVYISADCCVRRKPARSDKMRFTALVHPVHKIIWYVTRLFPSSDLTKTKSTKITNCILSYKC